MTAKYEAGKEWEYQDIYEAMYAAGLHPIVESFQIQMGFSFPFLRANDLRLSLLIMRTHRFLLSCTWGVHTQG